MQEDHCAEDGVGFVDQERSSDSAKESPGVSNEEESNTGGFG